MHGTTVATNAVLTGRGAKVGLITIVLKIPCKWLAHFARWSGRLGYLRKETLACTAELFVGAAERIAADGSVVAALDEAALRESLKPGCLTTSRH